MNVVVDVVVNVVVDVDVDVIRLRKGLSGHPPPASQAPPSSCSDRLQGGLPPCLPPALRATPPQGGTSLYCILLAALLAACGLSPIRKEEALFLFAPVNVYGAALSPFHAGVGWEERSGGRARYLVQRRDPLGGWRTVGERGGAERYFMEFGLDPATAYQYRVGISLDGERVVWGGAITVTTPPSPLPPLRAETFDPDAVQQGATMFNVEDFDNLADFSYLAVADLDGRWLWMVGGGPRSRYLFDFDFLPGGHIVANETLAIEEINRGGEKIRRYDKRLFHHDVDPTPWGTLLTLISYGVRGDGGIVYNNEAIVELDLARGVELFSIPVDEFVYFDEVCDICFLVPPLLLDDHDWTHTNAVALDEDLRHVYLSVRNLNRVYRLSYPEGKVDWVMGDGGDFGAGLFAHQHDPELTPDGTMLLFDNGLHRRGAPDFSRVIEIAFDPARREARIVWEYRETPDFFSEIGGDANRLPNGNTLITDSMNGRIVEVTPGKVPVWQLQLPHPYRIYKAVRLEK